MLSPASKWTIQVYRLNLFSTVTHQYFFRPYIYYLQSSYLITLQCSYHHHFIEERTNLRCRTQVNWLRSLWKCMHACMLSHFSCVCLFATLWTAARQATLSMGFSRQEYWRGLPCSPPGDLPDPRVRTCVSCGSFIVGGFFTAELPGKPENSLIIRFIKILDLYV